MSMIPNILVDHLCGAENSLPSPGSRQCDTKQPLLGRAMLIGRPCLVFECLREAMNLRGIETHACRFEKPFSLSVSEYGYDVLVIFNDALRVSREADDGRVAFPCTSCSSRCTCRGPQCRSSQLLRKGLLDRHSRPTLSLLCCRRGSAATPRLPAPSRMPSVRPRSAIPFSPSGKL